MGVLRDADDPRLAKPSQREAGPQAHPKGRVFRNVAHLQIQPAHATEAWEILSAHGQTGLPRLASLAPTPLPKGSDVYQTILDPLFNNEELGPFPAVTRIACSFTDIRRVTPERFPNLKVLVTSIL